MSARKDRTSQKRHRELVLAGEVQSGPAGYQDGEAGTGCEQISKLRGSLNDLLKVVQQQEQMLIAQISL